MLVGKKVLIFGLGVSGFAAAKLAVHLKADVFVLDTGSEEALQSRVSQLRELNVQLCLGKIDEAFCRNADLAIISPGIPKDSPLGKLAKSLDCKLISELEFGFQQTKCPVIAITGTNGKTTTVEMTVHCLKAAGKKVAAAGNIGIPLSEQCLSSNELDFIVVEVSSFQLEDCVEFAPLAASCLNITSDHIDRYADFDDYLQTKLKLFDNVDSSKVVIGQSLWEQLGEKRNQAFKGEKPLMFNGSSSEKADFFVNNQAELCFRQDDEISILLKQNELQLIGRHNCENALAALSLSYLAGVDLDRCASAIKSFKPSPHRLEILNFDHEVKFINDSKSTNPDAMVQAIQTIKESLGDKGQLLLIAGGKDKAMDFSPVLSELKEKVKEVFLIGELKETLSRLFSPVVRCQIVESLESAVDASLDKAEAEDVVLLSPGAASLDMFINYADRGNQFSQFLKRRLS